MRPSQFRRQLTVHLTVLSVFMGTTVVTAVAEVWPAAVLQAVFVLGWTARVVVLFRIRRLGGYAPDVSARPPAVRLNREYALVLRTQLVGWLAAGVYFIVIRFWLGVAVAAFLASFTVPLLRSLRRGSQGTQDEDG